MNPDSFFENAPWLHVLEEVRKGAVGTVVAVSVQVVCVPGELDAVLQGWLDRLEGWLGRPVRSDLLRSGPGASLLLRYEGPVLGRVFLDEGGPPAVSSFEVVGTEGLLVWKPDARVLSTILAEARSEIAHEDAYAARLEEVRS